jgi:tetratricopeptide (TPR) repeat protein
LKERPDLLLSRQERGESLWQLGNKEEAAAAWADAVQRNGRLSLAGNFLAGAERLLGRTEDAIGHEKQADQFTPDIPAYHWMLGLRLQNVGMQELAQKHFQRAAQLDPRFRAP